ncbi:aquaporin-9 isoform X1 [Sceloporus undulatus]|uniref:aquaporin-9 isoform X1 n=1 Tax=Sceloporus undulatus TaxID=8520 RepID=UPI001C4DD6E8|nr:aquaporin-9 isoform X1 [Sceloporus undulatus]
MCLTGKMTWIRFPIYVLAQFLGAFAGAAAVFGINYGALMSYTGGDFNVTGPKATAHIFATYPEEYLSLINGFADQVMSTALLLLGVFAIFDTNNLGIPKGLEPIGVGMLIILLTSSMALNCGCAMNPARDLAPRLFTYFAGWGPEVFTTVPHATSMNSPRWRRINSAKGPALLDLPTTDPIGKNRLGSLTACPSYTSQSNGPWHTEKQNHCQMGLWQKSHPLSHWIWENWTQLYKETSYFSWSFLDPSAIPKLECFLHGLDCSAHNQKSKPFGAHSSLGEANEHQKVHHAFQSFIVQIFTRWGLWELSSKPWVAGVMGAIVNSIWKASWLGGCCATRCG